MLTLGDRFGFRTQTLHIPCSPLQQPLRLLHLSDLHLLPTDTAKLNFIRRVTDDDYDFVFLTGDIAETPQSHSLVPTLLSRMPRFGAYAVLGNHDHLHLSPLEGIQEFITQRPSSRRTWNPVAPMKASFEAGERWRVLINESVHHDFDGQRIVIAGVDDPYTQKGDMQLTMRHVKKADVLIGLVHVPTDLATFSQRGFHLVLSGHTHGGQIRLPFIGALRTQCDLPARYAQGLHFVERTAVHVSAGLGAGTVIRARFLCPPTAYDIRLGG